MHETAGDTILPKVKNVSRSVFLKDQKASLAQANEPPAEPLPSPSLPDEKDDIGAVVEEKHSSLPRSPSAESILPMTRRFSVAEKVRILNKCTNGAIYPQPVGGCGKNKGVRDLPANHYLI